MSPDTNRAVGWTRFAVALHWLVALLVLTNLGLGIVAHEMAKSPAKLEAFLWHKSIGLTVLGLAGLRLCWRLSHAPPAAPDSLTAFQRRASAGVHWSLYVLIFAIPLSGWWLNSAANFPLRWFGLFEVPALVGADEMQKELAKEIHEVLGWVLTGLLCLHVGAALKHHFRDRDVVLRRMWPARGGAWALAFAALALPALIAWRVLAIPTSADAPLAQPSSELAPSGPAASASRWVVRSSASRLTFLARYDDVPFTGRFKRFDADLRFDPARPASGRFDVRIDIGSVDSDSSDRDEGMLAPDWFHAVKFPDARFVTRQMRADGEGGYTADAQLRIRDITRDIAFPFRWSASPDAARLQAEVVLDRRHFNVGTGSWARDDSVGFEVLVQVDLLLEPAR